MAFFIFIAVFFLVVAPLAILLELLEII